VLAVAAAVAPLACSSFSTSSPGVAGDGSADGAPADAGAEPTDAGPSPCLDAHLFCDDFEGSLGKWELDVGKNDNVAIEADDAGGHHLVARLLAEGSGDEALVRHPFATNAPLRIHLRFRVTNPGYASGVDLQSNFFVLRVAVDALDERRSVYVSPSETIGAVSGAGASAVSGPSATAKFGLWHTLTLETSFTPPSSRLSLTVDGVPLRDPGTVVGNVGGPATLSLGVGRPNLATPPLQVEIDDVTVDELN
jgi:hypothetical protein